MAKPMSRKRFRTLSSELDAHIQWLNVASCREDIGSPFGDEGGVSITAIIENFGEAQQKALNTWLNTNTRKGWGSMSKLQATPLDWVGGGGIQFTTSGNKRDFIINLGPEYAECNCLDFNYHLDDIDPTFGSFFRACTIQFQTNEPFGKSTARRVYFGAGSTLPLFFMIEIKMMLESGKLCQELGLGEVAILGCCGLPNKYSDRRMLRAYKEFPIE
jgi:hypothetical protein